MLDACNTFASIDLGARRGYLRHASLLAALNAEFPQSFRAWSTLHAAQAQVIPTR
jgi:hypothetical protein